MQQNNFSEKREDDIRFWRRVLRHSRGITEAIEERLRETEQKKDEPSGSQLNERGTARKS